MFRPTVAYIHKDNLRHNVRTLKSLAQEKIFFCPMVKANAYGHGDIEVTKVLVDEGVDNFGVSLVEEGARLREAKIKSANIFVFTPCLDKMSVEAMLDYSLIPVVSSWEELQLLEAHAKKSPIEIHLKFNTGMSRLGFAPVEAQKLAAYIKKNKKIRLTGVCSHFLAGEDFYEKKSRSQAQVALFKEITHYFSGLELISHMHNSASLISQYSFSKNNKSNLGVRPGISIYGIKPEIHFQNAAMKNAWQSIELRPVMEVKSKIIHLQKLAEGETVSYGGLFKAGRETLIGVVPIGYADGYMRNFSNKSKVLCRGKKVSVTGIVCMDYTMINLSESFSKTKEFLNEEVVLIGEQLGQVITSEELARLAHTNSYEVLTQMSARLPRVYL